MIFLITEYKRFFIYCNNLGAKEIFTVTHTDWFQSNFLTIFNHVSISLPLHTYTNSRLLCKL